MQSEQTFIQRTFQVTNELTGHMIALSIKVVYIPNTREINISRAIADIHSRGIQLHNSLVFYLDFHRKMYVHIGNYPFKQEILLKYQLFLDSSIKIRFRKIVHQNPATQEITCPAPSQPPRKKKVKERTIKEALDYVRRWRSLYDLIDTKGKKIHTLESAANEVGMAKKTLDDYYYQLRQAEYYQFNFEAHKDDKIGVLRNYVRNCIKNNLKIENKMSGNECDSDDIDRYLASSDSDEDRR